MIFKTTVLALVATFSRGLQTEVQTPYFFEDCAEVDMTQGQCIWTDFSQGKNQFCTTRSDMMAFYLDRKCCKALHVAGRTLDLNGETVLDSDVRMTIGNMSETQKLWDDGFGEFTQIENYHKDTVDYSDLQSIWTLMLKSGNDVTTPFLKDAKNPNYDYIARPYIMDPDFPYIQIMPNFFEVNYKADLIELGFKEKYSDMPTKNMETVNKKRITYVADQTCQNLYGCFEDKQFIVTDKKKSDNIFEFPMNPRDFLVETGENECTFGITSCTLFDLLSCPEIAGKVFMKNFETIFDYESNDIYMKQIQPKYDDSLVYTCSPMAPSSGEDDTREPTDENPYKEIDMHDGTAPVIPPQTWYQPFLDGVWKAVEDVMYWFDFKNVYYQLIGHPLKVVADLELVSFIIVLLVPAAIFFFIWVWLVSMITPYMTEIEKNAR